MVTVLDVESCYALPPVKRDFSSNYEANNENKLWKNVVNGNTMECSGHCLESSSEGPFILE